MERTCSLISFVSDFFCLHCRIHWGYCLLLSCSIGLYKYTTTCLSRAQWTFGHLHFFFWWVGATINSTTVSFLLVHIYVVSASDVSWVGRRPRGRSTATVLGTALRLSKVVVPIYTRELCFTFLPRSALLILGSLMCVVVLFLKKVYHGNSQSYIATERLV